jgi:phosphatidylglycerol lysyltransferase
MRFMVTLDLFSHAHERRYFIAEDDTGLVGLMVGVPIYGRKGWLLDDLLVLRGSAPGASEALVDLAMSRFSAEGVGYVSLGMVALIGLGEGQRSRHAHPILDRVFNFCLRSMSWLYSFHGIHAFRSKFKPDRWEPVYLVGYKRVHVFTMRAVLMAFSGGWLPRFVGRVAAHQLAPRLRQAEPYLFPGLSLAMLGWTPVLLSHASLFGGPGAALGWVAFDWVQAAVLWRPERSRQAAGLALLDAAMNLTQWVLQPPRPKSFTQQAVVAASVFGPLALAGLLWLHSESREIRKD